MQIYLMAKHQKTKFKKTGITKHTLLEYLKNSNITVKYYDDGYFSSIHLNELEEYSKRKNAFTYKHNDSIIIFIRKGLEETFEIKEILHEWCHILRKHTPKDDILGKDNLIAEIECSKFIYYFTSKVQPVNLLKSVICIGIISTVIFLNFYNYLKQNSYLSTFSSQTIDSFESSKTSTQPTTNNVIINGIEYNKNLTVFKTKTGKVVHKEGCRHLVGRQGISSMTLGTVIAAGIDPCSDCF